MGPSVRVTDALAIAPMGLSDGYCNSLPGGRSTGVGVVRVAKLPSPSSPLLFAPQQTSSSSTRKAQP